jgi:ligand-binding sensor domain-containing protein
MIDDSDVFSIIIDPRNPQIIFASACSGIYKSENGGQLFHKIQGMPFSARRTRVLYMDPDNSQIVYAGTTEGLWKTEDGGKNMRLMTSPKVVINDIYIDPRNSKKVMLATDRGGVLVSTDASRSFVASNQGFIHRQVTALLVDRNNHQKLYAATINGQELGGVFMSSDAGMHWKQMSAGLGGRDVFALRQTDSGALVAATADGVFVYANGAAMWKSMSAGLSRSAGKARVLDVYIAGGMFYAATTRGLYKSANQGRIWQLVPGTGAKEFVGVRARQKMIASVGRTEVAVSKDSGAHWSHAKMPKIVTSIRGMTISSDAAIWLATREGAFRSTDGGRHFEHMRNGLPELDVKSILYDESGKRMFATSGSSSEVYQSADNGQHWVAVTQTIYPVQSVTPAGGKLFVTTSHDGVLAQTEHESRAAGGGGN